jgi:hypothetical protein
MQPILSHTRALGDSAAATLPPSWHTAANNGVNGVSEKTPLWSLRGGDDGNTVDSLPLASRLASLWEKMQLTPLQFYWGLSTAVAVWFLLFHTPAFLRHRLVTTNRLVLALHLTGAGGLYIVCIHNSILTPGSGGWKRFSHVWLGRLGMLLGIGGFVSGLYLVWGPIPAEQPFGTIISLGGCLQLFSQVQGFRAIRNYHRVEATTDASDPASVAQRREAFLKAHIGYMTSLFVMACGIPAAIRLTEGKGLVAILVVIYALQTLAGRFTKAWYTRVDGAASATVS